MEGKTPTEKVHSLSNMVSTLTEQVKTHDGNIKDLAADLAATAQALGDVKVTAIRHGEQLDEFRRWKVELSSPDLKIEIAILKRDVEELRKVKDEWARRLWNLAGPLLGAVVGGFLGYFLR